MIAMVEGALHGLWLGSMSAVAVPNSRLRAFQGDLERGRVLLIVDVPYARVDEVRATVRARHPEALPGGLETRYPAFP
jgi:ligand-binding sensor domain-containing protein